MKYILLVLTLLICQIGHTQLYTQMADMPMAISNNAVTGAIVNDVPMVYSFCGIDQSKTYSGINLNSFKYNTETNEWTTLPSIIDPLGGKIAAGASTVKNKIYVIGGYHVSSNGNETSSSKTHIFDLTTDNFETDGADLLTAIDDHIQCVWRDSLIYVVTGWSNTNNINKVQVYNPTTDIWQYGTSTPNNTKYKVFGGSGTIIGDTIFYSGGAKYASNFPATTILRKGVINPDNPLEIEWSETTSTNAKNYRAACVTDGVNAYWLGGSHTTYNYDGIAYNGSGGVLSNQKIKILAPQTNTFTLSDSFPPIMDLRGAAIFDNGDIYIAGGMINPQEVTDHCYKINLSELISTKDVSTSQIVFLKVLPNPNSGQFTLETPFKGNYQLTIFNQSGQIIYSDDASYNDKTVNLDLDNTFIFIDVTYNDKHYSQKIFIH